MIKKQEMNAPITQDSYIEDSCTNITTLEEMKEEINKLKLVTSIILDDIDKINKNLNNYVLEGCM